MPQAALVQDNTPAIPDIDSLLKPTADEYARTRAIAAVHMHAMLNLRFAVRDQFDKIAPQFERDNGRPLENSMETIKALGDNHFFKFYSSIRYNAQEMGPLAKQPVVERAPVVDTSRTGALSSARPGYARPAYNADGTKRGWFDFDQRR